MSDPVKAPVPRHVPVMPHEVMHYLAPAAGEIFVDATVGGGGHTRLLAERVAPAGRVIGLDRDAAMLDLARPQLTHLPVILIQRSFDEVDSVLSELGIDRVDGVLADLGVSSDQLDDPRRGLTFQHEGPLDMRMDVTQGEPASSLVNRVGERELADLIFKYGEERFSRRIARRIVETRRRTPFETSTQLAELVRRCVPRSRKQSIDPATRTFQALRIAVNDELGALERLLKSLPNILKPGGRAAIISFHSLEDRLVKQAFRQKDMFEQLTRKPVQAGEEELRNNPRARSAKLRAARTVVREGA
jgi:16S rRNA (cytosine1402-N4)-methyltransferase